MKITLNAGWSESLWTHNGNKEGKRQRGSHVERDKCDECARECACQPVVVWISYSAVPLAPAIVEDTSALSSQGSVPTCIKGLSKALLTPPGLLLGSPQKNQGFSITPSDTMNTCSALITIPCFSEIVSAAIFLPNYFLVLWGLGSRLEPEEVAQGGQEGGGWWAGYYRAGIPVCSVKEVQCADIYPFEGLGFNLAPGEVTTFCAAKILSSELLRR